LVDPANAVKELTFTLDPSSINGAAPINNFKIGLSSLTQYESKSTAFAKTNDGYKLGELTKMSIGSDGKVIGQFNNGDTKALGQIVTATFSNVNGLQKQGDNLWAPTENSGEANINKPGSGGNGALLSGALEMSNVDLAKEFTNMIVTQRGFQANSRVITTTDQMLEELVNLKR
jgi:fagellar hook-basal body proteins